MPQQNSPPWLALPGKVLTPACLALEGPYAGLPPRCSCSRALSRPPSPRPPRSAGAQVTPLTSTFANRYPRLAFSSKMKLPAEATCPSKIHCSGLLRLERSLRRLASLWKGLTTACLHVFLLFACTVPPAVATPETISTPGA